MQEVARRNVIQLTSLVQVTDRAEAWRSRIIRKSDSVRAKRDSDRPQLPDCSVPDAKHTHCIGTLVEDCNVRRRHAHLLDVRPHCWQLERSKARSYGQVL